MGGPGGGQGHLPSLILVVGCTSPLDANEPAFTPVEQHDELRIWQAEVRWNEFQRNIVLKSSVCHSVSWQHDYSQESGAKVSQYFRWSGEDCWKAIRRTHN